MSQTADDSLIRREIEVIQAIAKRFHRMTAKQICEATHRHKAWKWTPLKTLALHQCAKHAPSKLDS